MKPTYMYTDAQIKAFWACDDCNDVLPIAISEALDFLITRNLYDDASLWKKCVATYTRCAGVTTEEVDDMLWWTHAYLLCVYGRTILAPERQHWIFNTPCHPFEVFLNKELSRMGVNPYTTYCVTYPD